MKRYFLILSALSLVCLFSSQSAAQNVVITVTVDANGLTQDNLESKTTLTCLRNGSVNCGIGSNLSDFVAIIEPNEKIKLKGQGPQGVNVKVKELRIKNNQQPNILSKGYYDDRFNNGKINAETKISTKPGRTLEDSFDIFIEVKSLGIGKWVDPKLRMPAG